MKYFIKYYTMFTERIIGDINEYCGKASIYIDIDSLFASQKKVDNAV